MRGLSTTSIIGEVSTVELQRVVFMKIAVVSLEVGLLILLDFK